MLLGGWDGKAHGRYDIDTGTVIASVDLGIWRDGESLDVRLNGPTTIGALLDNLIRLLGLPMRTWDGQPVDYWLHPAREKGRLDDTARLDEIEVPLDGLVLASSRTAFDVRADIDRMAKGVGADIRKAIDDEIQQGLNEVKGAVTGEINAIIRDIREQVTRRVTDLIPGRGKGVREQFLAAVGLRKVAKTDAWVEYQDAVELGLGRARRHAGGAWRALGGLAAQAGTAGVAGAATAGAAAAAVLAVSAATVVTIGVFTGALDGKQGERGLPGSVITASTEVVTTTTPVETTTTLTIEPPVTVSVTYIVQPDDTLWKVARDECGGDAPARELVRRVLSLWVVNLELVGSDPNSIDAGQELEVVCDGVLD